MSLKTESHQIPRHFFDPMNDEEVINVDEETEEELLREDDDETSKVKVDGQKAGAPKKKNKPGKRSPKEKRQTRNATKGMRQRLVLIISNYNVLL